MLTLSQTSQRGRVLHLDGLRGIAALSVLVEHYLDAMFTPLTFGSRLPEFALADAISRSPLFAFYNGAFAVHVFFVLSGFVIARSADGTAATFPALAARRYLRLTVPALVSTLLAYVLVRMFPGAAPALGLSTDNRWLQGMLAGGETRRLFDAFWDAVFNSYRFGEVFFNRPLWTMRTELAGSLMIYAFYKLVPPAWRPYGLITGAICLTLTHPPIAYLLPFLAGAALHEAARRDLLSASRWAPVLVVLGLYLGSNPIQDERIGIVFSTLRAALDPIGSSHVLIFTLAATLLLLGLLQWPGAKRALAAPPLAFLGRISFLLYLTHMPILLTVVCHVALGQTRSGLMVAALGVGFVAATIGLAYLLTVLVDEPLIAAITRLKSLHVSRPLLATHLLVLAALLGFMASRIGPDPLSLLVAALGYISFVMGGLALLQTAITVRRT